MLSLVTERTSGLQKSRNSNPQITIFGRLSLDPVQPEKCAGQTKTCSTICVILVRYSQSRYAEIGTAFDILLHYALAAAQCIAIAPACVFVGLCVCSFVCRSVTMITRNCMHRSSPNWVCR